MIFQKATSKLTKINVKVSTYSLHNKKIKKIHILNMMWVPFTAKSFWKLMLWLCYFFSFILGLAHSDPLFVQTAGPKIAMFRGFTYLPSVFYRTAADCNLSY